VDDLRQRVEAELTAGIPPFWLKYSIDNEYGGFRGRISNDLTIDRHAAKGLILNARILWTFSKAFTVYRAPVYLAAARRAYEYISQYFWDNEFGGVYWMVDCEGRPLDTKKRIYGQVFTVYALAEYAHSSGDHEAIAKAMRLVERIESAGHDDANSGYFETFERDWTAAADQRLSEVDMDDWAACHRFPLSGARNRGGPSPRCRFADFASGRDRWNTSYFGERHLRKRKEIL
jgi:mannobiose 2-epimerase